MRYHAAVIHRLLVPLACMWLVAIPNRTSAQVPAADARGEVLVILWFDTEDYLLPASDDAAKRVAEILTARGVRGTFKIVGEKARVLERRGRTDVIAALKRHDMGTTPTCTPSIPRRPRILPTRVDRRRRGVRSPGGRGRRGRQARVRRSVAQLLRAAGILMGAAGVRRPPADRCCHVRRRANVRGRRHARRHR